MDPNRARIPYERCPLCDARERVEIKVVDCRQQPNYRPPLPTTLRWLECRSCGHVYVDGYFSQEALDILLSDTMPNQAPGHDIETTRYVSAKIVENVSTLLPGQSGRWLDVGFGNGSLLTTAAEFGFDVTGLDVRPAIVQTMRDYGFDAQAIALEDYQPEAPFDVVSMADSLEHMPFPKRALERAFGLTREGGLLFLSMPNSDSFLWQTLTRNGVNPYWYEIEHYHNFGRKRLYSLLGECGFTPIRYAVSIRYRACMEVIARRRPGAISGP